MISDCSTGILISIINRLCRPDTTIYGYMWKLYYELSRSFRYDYVPVNPISSVNIPAIKSACGKIMCRFKQLKDVCKKNLKEYPDDICKNMKQTKCSFKQNLNITRMFRLNN